MKRPPSHPFVDVLQDPDNFETACQAHGSFCTASGVAVEVQTMAHSAPHAVHGAARATGLAAQRKRIVAWTDRQMSSKILLGEEVPNLREGWVARHTDGSSEVGKRLCWMEEVVPGKIPEVARSHPGRLWAHYIQTRNAAEEVGESDA